MKRMLHIVGGMYPGGLENFIMNIYRNLDRETVQFDVIVHSIREGDYTKELKDFCKYFPYLKMDNSIKEIK